MTGSGSRRPTSIKMVADGIAQANITRAAIRLPINRHARMVFAVADEDGRLLGIYRMPDATVFSIDVAVAKARNVAYYNNASQLQPIDQVPRSPPGRRSRTGRFRYLSGPASPRGSTLSLRPVLDPQRRRDQLAAPRPTSGPRCPASAFQSVQGYDSFNPGTNFHEHGQPAQPERDRLLPRQLRALQGRQRPDGPRRRAGRQRRRRRPGRRRDVYARRWDSGRRRRSPGRSFFSPRGPPALPEVQPQP